jgi:hypothetical protein
LNLKPLISVDMVRINFKMLSTKFEKMIQPYWDTTALDHGGKHIVSYAYSAYRHLWNVPQADSSATIMFELNSEIAKQQKHGAIEWNPNKVTLADDPKLWGFVRQVIMSASDVWLARCDVAYDLPGIRVEQCVLDKRNKHQVRTIFEKYLTMYAGAPGRPGQVKIYNKQAEMIGKGKADPGILTRFETTYKARIGHSLQNNQVYCTGTLETTESPELLILSQATLDDPIDNADLLMLIGLEHAPYLWDGLTRRKKEKIKAMQSVTTFRPDLLESQRHVINWYEKFLRLMYAFKL